MTKFNLQTYLALILCTTLRLIQAQTSALQDSLARKISSIEFKTASGILDDVDFNASHRLQCQPDHKSLSIFSYFVIQEQPNKSEKAIIFTVPNVLSVYATLYRFNEVWLHVNFLTKQTAHSNFKFNVHRKRWVLLHIQIQSKDIIVHVEDEYNMHTKTDRHEFYAKLTKFRHQKQYFLRKPAPTLLTF